MQGVVQVAKQGQWVKLRKPMSKYPETPQQKKVKIGGKMISIICKGKKGEEFIACRSLVLKCAFNDNECEGHLLDVKREILEKD